MKKINADMKLRKQSDNISHALYLVVHNKHVYEGGINWRKQVQNKLKTAYYYCYYKLEKVEQSRLGKVSRIYCNCSTFFNSFLRHFKHQSIANSFFLALCWRVSQDYYQVTVLQDYNSYDQLEL